MIAGLERGTLPCYSGAMIRGLYRTRDRLLGDCVRVHWSAGDAAPYLGVELYQALGGQPELTALPSREVYAGCPRAVSPDPFELA